MTYARKAAVPSSAAGDRVAALRLPRAAKQLGIEVDELLRRAVHGDVRLFIAVGGHKLLTFETRAADDGQRGHILGHSLGVRDVFGDLYVDGRDIAAVLARGRARIRFLLVDCDDPGISCLPGSDNDPLEVGPDDLWLELAPSGQARLTHQPEDETVEGRRLRRYRRWTVAYQGAVHLTAAGGKLTCDSGVFGKFVAELRGNSERGCSPKTVRKDLIEGARLERGIGGNVSSKLPGETSPARRRR